MVSTQSAYLHLAMEVKMKTVKYPLSLVFLLSSSALLSTGSFSEQLTDAQVPVAGKESLANQLAAIDENNHSAGWKIRGGCLSANRIKRIKFIDDQTALVTMFGKKTAILRLQKECPGIKRSGYVTYRNSSKLCARFDRLSVMGGSGYSCRIASIEPFVELEEPVPEKNID
jgi:hypothetical protein